jgi:predicted HTH transcriptional regulator
LTDAIRLLDYSAYFDITGIPQPTDADGILHYMIEEGIIIKQDNGLYAITNLGAILLAKKLSDFPKISRKAIRVVQYQGNNRMNMLKEDIGGKGYVVGFEGLIKFIEALIPTQELISGALREKKTAYPILAIREAVANALIHQDFSITGTGPVVEIFENRIEITNSGTPLVDVKRIVDNPPKSRNEKLAALMRRLRMCEELGTGWDKIVLTCEILQLPAPKIGLYEESTRVTLFSEMPFSNISMEDKLWACYLHACVKHVQGEHLTNSSLRERFGVKESSSGSISRLIKEAVELELIKPLDPTTAPRYMKYIPIWA